jgi:YD repeat-containing protein
VAETDYAYDQTAVSGTSGVAQHDYKNYSSSYNIRGNATSKSEWVNTIGNWLTWNYSYDDTGQQRTMSDPKGNGTTYSFADAFPACGPTGQNTNAYLTNITDAKGFTQSFTYRYCDGQLNSATDRNNQPTTYSYTNSQGVQDPLGRLKEVDYPDGGQTLYTYTDTPLAVSVAESDKIDSTGQLYLTTKHLDGVGHVTQSQLNSDPDCSGGADNTDTTYDGMGKVWTVSNPYCSTASGSKTNGTTKYTYDAIGRVTDEGSTKSIVYPDLTATSTTYSSTTTTDCSTVTDPAGKVRQLCSDALGRVTSVTEDPGQLPHLNYQTAYAYNALDNLTTVAQGSQTRTFVYDSLSRLTSASNPESGTTHFCYTSISSGSPCATPDTGTTLCSGDPSALCRGTDARGVTAYYDMDGHGNLCAYEALNRVVCKSYSDTTTPIAHFYYDESAVALGSWTSPALPYPNGRLTHTTTVSFSSGALQTATVQDYDPMGRTVDYWQCMYSNCGTSSIWYSQYLHEYTGEVYKWIHPANYTITNSISSARRITSIQSSRVDRYHPQYLAKNITYTPWGAVSTLVNGYAGSSGTQAQETYTYNNRLQPWMIELGTNGGNLSADYCLLYNYNSTWTPPSTCPDPSLVPTSGSGNNGNVVGYWYLDNVNPFSHTAAYSYDAVNRLLTAAATPFGSGTASYNFTYSYTQDGSSGQYGNMTCMTSGSCTVLSFNAGNNQIKTTGYSYDLAGNLLTDPSNGTTHTYQWDAEGRVAKVDGGSTWNFTYNALGHRAQWAYGSAGAADQHLFDPGGGWLGVAGSYSLVRRGDSYMLVYTASDTSFNHVNHLGSTSMFTNHAGTAVEDMLFYPWGDVWQSWGSGGYNFAYLPYRDLKTTTDLTTARISSPNFGRWFSPDPDNVGADPSDPQGRKTLLMLELPLRHGAVRRCSRGCEVGGSFWLCASAWLSD